MYLERNFAKFFPFFFLTKFKWISLLFIIFIFTSTTFIHFYFQAVDIWSIQSDRPDAAAWPQIQAFSAVLHRMAVVLWIYQKSIWTMVIWISMQLNMFKQIFGECSSPPNKMIMFSFLFIGFCFHIVLGSLRFTIKKHQSTVWILQRGADILYEVPVGIIVLLSIFYGSISIIAVIGNCLVIWIVATTRQMQTVTNLFIANLALADVVIGMFVIPFQVNCIRACMCVFVSSYYYSNFLHCLHISLSSCYFVLYQNIPIVSLIYWITFLVDI